jgi:hypothetical protein
MGFLNSLLSKSPPVKEFKFAPPDNEPGSFFITLRYIPPGDFEAKQSEITAAVRLKAGEDDDRMVMRLANEKVFLDVIEPAIVSVRGMRIGSLRTLLAWDPDRVKALGGPDKPFEPDREDLRVLLKHCKMFALWCAAKIVTIGDFQDADHEKSLGNSESGQASSTEQTHTSATPTQ